VKRLASEVLLRATLAIFLTLILIGSAAAQSDTERGQTLAMDLCGGCHAVGKTGASPHASAPTFRQLDDHIDLDSFMDLLRDGLQSSHPDMPSFRFSRGDARAIVAYLRSIQGP
jgi:cytochrome c